MDELKYADWSLRMHQRLADLRIPTSGTIEVTHRCNNRCVHCFNNLPLHDSGSRHTELSVERHRRILDEISAAGCLWLLFTGGEIFARPDFPNIYTYAKHQGLLITLFTNGTLITPQIADFLANWRPFSIEITIYGRTRSTHERITGVAGSYDRCLRGIHLLMDRGLPLKLKTMVMVHNQHEIWEMKRFVEEDLGLEFKFDAMINPRRNGAQCPLSARLAPEEIVALDLMDRNRVAEWHKFAAKFVEPITSADPCEALYNCGAGLQSFCVDPFGRLRLCTLAAADGYDLIRGSFRQGWEQYLQNLRLQPITRQTKCNTCGLKSMCGMCPANGELECRDFETPVDFLCRVAHLRAYALDIPIPPHGQCTYCEGGIRHKEMIETAGGLKERLA